MDAVPSPQLAGVNPKPHQAIEVIREIGHMECKAYRQSCYRVSRYKSKMPGGDASLHVLMHDDGHMIIMMIRIGVPVSHLF
jgi:hypothetical protein